jgi:hypothetical protein
LCSPSRCCHRLLLTEGNSMPQDIHIIIAEDNDRDFKKLGLAIAFIFEQLDPTGARIRADIQRTETREHANDLWTRYHNIEPVLLIIDIELGDQFLQRKWAELFVAGLIQQTHDDLAKRDQQSPEPFPYAVLIFTNVKTYESQTLPENIKLVIKLRRSGQDLMHNLHETLETLLTSLLGFKKEASI